MKRLSYIIVVFLVLIISSCSRMPAIMIGDSSGYLQYNRATGILEILWEKHVEVKDSTYVKDQPS